ncbi:MAG: anaerobic ribonucleoside-triphosphate reductase activating protein [Chloroflexota bacterium]|nr:anaerobic ribonucleoside-triphosphate reductase activating protein [Chloroflexota bacterium]
MEIKGWIKTSLIDYPEHIATVLFTGGCDFRCPMCHNADLVLRPGELPTLPLEEVWEFLSRRAGLVDGVVITGGEPTLQPDLPSFLRQARALELDIKLDTNGHNPDILESLLDEELVDYVAMDVKAPPAKYPRLAGRPDLDLQRVERSVALLRGSGVPCEFRTTIVPGLLTEEDVEEIARWIAGAERYVLQQFRPLGALDPSLEKATPYPVERLQAMAERAGRWVNQVTVRGSGIAYEYQKM